MGKLNPRLSWRLEINATLRAASERDDMYGMVNKLFVEALGDEFGSEAWSEIQERSGATDGFFVGMEQYPDEVTYSIIEAASEVVGIPGGTLLEMLGKKWVEMTAQGEYGHYYAMADDLFDFLKNLNAVHESLAAGLPKLRPPSFSTSQGDKNTLRLTYESSRPGLTSFVVGLIHGLADHYGQNVVVAITSAQEKSAEFSISIV